MGHLLLILENLAVSLLLVALGVAMIARIKRSWLRAGLATLLLMVPLAFYSFLLLLDAMAVRSRLDSGWSPWFGALGVLSLVGGLAIAVRGLGAPRAESEAERPAAPRARRWPPGKLALALVAVVLLQAMTFVNLDAAGQQKLDNLQAEAYALAVSAAPEPVRDEENAALVYVRAQDVLERGEPPYQKTSPQWPQLWLDATDALGASEEEPPPFDFASPELGAWLAGRQGEILLLRQAAEKPGCDFGRDYGNANWSTWLPEIQGMRRAVQLLAVDARHRAATGDLAGALANVQAMYAASRHTAREPFGVNMLVAAALDELTLATLQAILHSADMAPAESLVAVDTHPEFSYRRDMQRILRASEAMTLNSLIHLDATLDDLDLVNDYNWQAWAGSSYRVFLLDNDLENYRSSMRELRRLPGRDYKSTREGLTELRARLGQRPSGTMLDVVEGYLNEVDMTFLADARKRVAEAGLAMHRYRAEHGKFPERLDELTPKVIPVIPTDPYDEDAPLRLEKTGGNWIVYSIGPDMKDDRGAAWNRDDKTGDVGFSYEAVADDR